VLPGAGGANLVSVLFSGHAVNELMSLQSLHNVRMHRPHVRVSVCLCLCVCVCVCLYLSVYVYVCAYV
jgi:hypothetical protein